MSYIDILTEDEYDSFVVNLEILRYLEYARAQLGLEKQDMNVLDWGCGRGNYVLYLRRAGYNAYGVDVSADAISRGKGLINRSGYDADDLLAPIGNNGKTRHPDGFFHFVFSYQVLEHVEDMKLVTQEIARITSTGGFGLHIYPGKWRPIEGHLFMPFVHWLPKNAIRRVAIYMFALLGVEPRWKEANGLNSWQKARIYFSYSEDETFYRPYGAIRESFTRSGFSAKSVVMDHPSLERFRWIPGGIIEGMVLAFKTVELLTVKAHDLTQSDRRSARLTADAA